jgi:hypothetical protein
LRRLAGWHEYDLVETKRCGNFARSYEVAVVNRVEGSTHYTQSKFGHKNLCRRKGLVVRLRVSALALTTVSHIAVAPGDPTHQEKYTHGDYAKKEGWKWQLNCVLRSLSEECSHFSPYYLVSRLP